MELIIDDSVVLLEETDAMMSRHMVNGSAAS